MSMVGRPGYKETTIGWIPDLWPVRRLEEISTDNITYGVVQPGPEDENGVRLVRGGDVKSGRVSTALRTISNAVSKQFSRTVLRGGELLVSLVGYPGETAIASKELAGANIARQVGLVRLSVSNDSHFVQQYLSSPIGKKVLLGGMIGSAQQVINLSALREVEVPLPPLPEQQKIAAILTALDEKLAIVARQIEATQTLTQGMMQTLFSRGVGILDASGRWVPHTKFKDSELGEIPASWAAAKLNSHVNKVGSGVTPKGGSDSYLSTGIPLIRSQNVLVGRLSLDDVVFISPEQHGKMRNSALSANDVLLNITGASIGRCAVLPADFEAGNVNQHVCIIRTEASLNPHFLCQYLNSEMGQKQVSRFQAGGNREGLNYQQIRSFDVPLPPVQEQHEIATVLGCLDEKVEVLMSKQAQYQTLKRGLMQKLLTGEWRVSLDASATAT